MNWSLHCRFPHPLTACSWEPECTLVALAYEYTIELCRTRPAFERFATVSIAESVAGGMWQRLSKLDCAE